MDSPPREGPGRGRSSQRRRSLRAPSGAGRSSRGQSSPLAVAMVFAVVLTGTVVVVAVGGQAITTTQSSLDVSRAETAMTQFDSQSAVVALGRAGSQQVELPGGSGATYAVRNDSGWVSITYRNFETMTDQAIMDRRQMGAVVYENGEETIAYQGGGVWRQSSGGSVMVSPPEFHYRNATLTFPFVTVHGETRLEERAVVTKNGTEQLFPDRSRPGFSNPLTNGKVWITLQSEYYRAWGQYFKQRTDGRVQYDHANERVRVTLVIPANYPAVEAGVISGAPSTRMVINNEAGLDSYNSSVAPYSGDLKHGSPDGTDSEIHVAGDLEIEKGDVYGDVVVGGDVVFSHNNGRLHDGNISYGNDVDPDDPYASGHWDVPDPATSEYWIEDNASVARPDSVQGLTDSRRAALADPDNDNDDENTIDESSDQIDCSAGCAIKAGAYYLESMDVNEPLTIDTSEGPVTIVVDGPINVNEDIEVVGQNRTNVYAEGSVNFANGAELSTPGDDATQFWLYTDPDETVTLKNNVVFTGVVFGPGIDGNPGTRIQLKQNAQVFGGVVGDLRIQNNNVRLHYDEALAQADSVTQRTTLPALTFLHVSENRVNVTSP